MPCLWSDTCSQPVKARGLCGRHYQAAREAGTFTKYPRRAKYVESARCGHPYPPRSAADPDCTYCRAMRPYGLTGDDYFRLLVNQDSKCAICRQPETQRGNNGQVKRLAVDHDHVTGRVRGLLCANCNQGLGRFRDSPNLLVQAAAYLGRAQ